MTYRPILMYAQPLASTPAATVVEKLDTVSMPTVALTAVFSNTYIGLW